MAGARAGERGFTLIELLVVLGIVALLATLAAPGLGTLTGANAREAAGRLAGAMRYMFDTSALRHETCRIALDPSQRSWWAECSPGPATVARDARDREDDEDLARRFPDEKDDEARRLLARTAFGGFSDRLVAKSELPGRAAFGKIDVEGIGDPEGRVAYVYFFPGGRALRAHIPVVDGSNVYTVVVEPFTGRARVIIGAVEVKR
jgi:general secretion pathway protein H